MEGFEVVTTDDEKLGTVVAESGTYLVVEEGMIRKSRHALPRAFAKVEESDGIVGRASQETSSSIRRRSRTAGSTSKRFASTTG